MTDLPVRELVLYKHGVGFFVREGVINGVGVTLNFKQDEINDALKSLTIFDRAGGQVLGIHYQTPMDRDARFGESSIRLSSSASLTDLLRDLRGRLCALTFESALQGEETIVGRIVGINQPGTSVIPKPQSPSVTSGEGAQIAILTEDNFVRVMPFDALLSISIQDDQAAHDLRYFLDTSMGDETRRTVNVRLSEGEHQLVVFYVAPSPTWRVSYRIVGELEAEADNGRALLQGWGLFDNRFDEDLQDVQVTLVAGQPISFIYDLYTSRIPERTTVQDEARIAPGPVEYAAEYMDAPMEERARGITLHAIAPAPMRESRMKAFSRAELADAAPPAAEGKEAGEFFEYRVTAPVSVKRGESALVPIISAEVNYERELLYNGAKLLNHPVSALRFSNTAGLTLERGPVTVIENGDYRGEAVVPFTKDGNPVYLPYAVELGVRVVENQRHTVETASLKIAGAYLLYDEYHIATTIYTIENTTARALTITVEAPIDSDYTPFDMPPTAAETISERRWRVTAPPQAKTPFVRTERHLSTRREEVRQLDYRRLKQFIDNRWLDEATLQQLGALLNNQALIQKAKSQQKDLSEERRAIYAQQEQIRANLGALQPTGDEAPLRARVLAQLEAAQNRLEAIDTQLTALAAQITQAEASTEQIIAALPA